MAELNREDQIDAIDFTPITDVVKWGKVELDIQNGEVELVSVKETFKRKK